MASRPPYKMEFHWKETHMELQCDVEIAFKSAKSAVMNSRILLEQYILKYPTFVTTLEPVEVDLNAPEFIRDMMSAGIVAGVGPMAAVAGGLSEIATRAMVVQKAKLALAENGGDISVKGSIPVTIGVDAGESSIAKNLAFKIKANDLPLGICTSGGSMGHSLSLGVADAVVVFSASAFLSDAAATSIANYVKSNDPEGSIQNALERAEYIDGVRGCMIVSGELVGITGKIPETVEVIDANL